MAETPAATSAEASVGPLSSAPVRATSGSLRLDDGLRVPHRWTPEGIVAEADGTGAHLLHLAVAVCLLNDTYREAEVLALQVDGVRVTADGGFDAEWRSTGVGYRVEVDTPASAEAVAGLLTVVDEVAEIPRVLRSSTDVRRAGP